MEALINLITSSLLMLVLVLMVRLLKVPPAHTQVLAVRVRHARLPIAHEASRRVAECVLTSSPVVLLPACRGHVKGVPANDPSNRELLLLCAPLLVVVDLEGVLCSRQTGASAKARMLVGCVSLLHAAHEVTWRVIFDPTLPILRLRDRGVLRRELLESDDHG